MTLYMYAYNKIKTLSLGKLGERLEKLDRRDCHMSSPNIPDDHIYIYIHKKRDQLIDIMSLRAALTVSAYVI